MTKKIFMTVICSLLLTIFSVGCSKHDYNPEDAAMSMLSGKYIKDGMPALFVFVNDEPLDNYESVTFMSKYGANVGNIRFVNVIPGVKDKKFDNVPLVDTEAGLSFKIDYAQNGKPVEITGILNIGEMTVSIKM